jgi:hypothetical protein
VDDHDLALDRKIFETIGHRFAPMASSYRQKKALGVALEDPWRRVSDVLARQDADNHRDVGARLECLNAVEQHRLSGDPPELFELGRSGAGPTTGGDDYYTDVALHGALSTIIVYP